MNEQEISSNQLPTLAAESDISITLYRAGERLRFIDVKDGGRTWVHEITGHTYSYEIRSRTRMAGACHALLAHGTLETGLGEKPTVPADAIYAARAREGFNQVQAT